MKNISFSLILTALMSMLCMNAVARDLTITDYSFNRTDMSSVQYTLSTLNNQCVFMFNIMVDKWSADIKTDTTYSLTDMLAAENGTFGMDSVKQERILYQSVSFSKNRIPTGVKIKAVIRDQRDSTWTLTYVGKDLPADTLYVELGQANDGIHPDGGVEYEMVDVSNSFSCHLVFSTEEQSEDIVPDSLYTSDDEGIDLEISYISAQKDEHDLVYAQFIKSVNGNEVSINAMVTDDRGFTYVLHYYNDYEFHPTGDTINISFNSEVSAVYYEDSWMIYAEGAKRIVAFQILSSNQSSAAGTYTDEVVLFSSHVDVLLDAKEDRWMYIQLLDVEYLTIAQIGDNYSIESRVLGDDGYVYQIAVNKNVEAVSSVETGTFATKRIRNGALVIEKNGVLYNALGTPIR